MVTLVVLVLIATSKDLGSVKEITEKKKNCNNEEFWFTEILFFLFISLLLFQTHWDYVPKEENGNHWK